MKYRTSAGFEAGCRREGVLHELEVNDLAIMHAGKNREGRFDGFSLRLRFVGESAKDGDVFTSAEQFFGRESQNLPELTDARKRVNECLGTFAGAGPRHDLFEIGIVIVE
jgi:hypothetical protein